MTTEMIKTIKAYTTLGEYVAAKELLDTITETGIEKEPMFAVALLYKLGIVEGKRQERARRKDGDAV